MKKNYGEQNGKEPKKAQLSGLAARRAARLGGNGQANYATATPGWLAAVIVAVTAQGGAIRFGYSRDGGVYAIGVYFEGEQEKFYVKQSEGIDQWCEELYNDLAPTSDESNSNGAGSGIS